MHASLQSSLLLSSLLLSLLPSLQPSLQLSLLLSLLPSFLLPCFFVALDDAVMRHQTYMQIIIYNNLRPIIQSKTLYNHVRLSDHSCMKI